MAPNAATNTDSVSCTVEGEASKREASPGSEAR